MSTIVSRSPARSRLSRLGGAPRAAAISSGVGDDGDGDGVGDGDDAKAIGGGSRDGSVEGVVTIGAAAGGARLDRPARWDRVGRRTTAVLGRSGTSSQM